MVSVENDLMRTWAGGVANAMRRRDVITLLSGAVVAWPFAARARQLAAAFQKAKSNYAKISHPSEAARSDYISRLVRMREAADRLKVTNDEWQAIDTEIKRHPAPNDPSSKTLSSLLAGEWESPRHDYLYRADGSWTMLPIEQGVTNGSWRIEGNQLFFSSGTEPPKQTVQFTIILITKRDFVFIDQTNIYYETRSK